jgi:cellulose synthase/poly-beta-1,6-N-acetylglucosamine synthase-like glycosyltransferase
VVDDHSEDGTREATLRSAAAVKLPNITFLALDSATGKPAAIAKGVSVSTGELILCTDADCVVPGVWIESMVKCFQPSVAFVAGPVVETPGTSLLSNLQALEYLGLTAVSAGLIGSGRPIICSGANIGFRKDAFEKVAGYGDDASSCDDETLMLRMFLRNAGIIAFNPDPQSIVMTPTPSSLGQFWVQRTRWAAKRGRYEDPTTLWRLVCLYCFFLFLLIGGVACLLETSFIPAVASVLLLKAMAEFSVLSSAARLLGRCFSVAFFLIAELFHVPYIAVAALTAQFTRMSWKNRKLNR